MGVIDRGESWDRGQSWGQEDQGDVEGHWEMWGSPMRYMGIQRDVGCRETEGHVEGAEKHRRVRTRGVGDGEGHGGSGRCGGL